MAAEHQVFQDRHVLEEFDVLEAPRDPHPGDLMGLETRDVRLLEEAGL